jgi:hypothetical protein
VAWQLWDAAYGHGYLFFLPAVFGGELLGGAPEAALRLRVGFETFEAEEDAGVGICWISDAAGMAGIRG